ncbi:SAM-dependent methyltransferase [Mycobacterium sp. 663a-19]|uniref:SAM-dependent methyltransferase n=1 Tax=Mycobacterium sp. 663a-19 TaxID=2986148 RepID=UPI002D1E58DB|nr:SAM-dependent methyltransferase [Mycobacterium sp. 663a-19]MEB3980078.1 SAM-dependent methyltransferase [Mycobacterium sp. 663a-19]
MPRSAGDTWDIVTSVGFTALAVCAARALDSELQPPLAKDDYAAHFVAAAGEPNLAAAIHNADMTSATAFNAQWVGVRTRFFDEFFVEAIEAGIRQVVILAAGLDSRGYRLAWAAGTRVFEVDQPRVLEFKQQVLDQIRAVPTAQRLTVATDLREDWPSALTKAGFEPDQPTAWALEGLLPYLPGAAQDALFERLHKLSSDGSRIAAELGPDPGEVGEFAQSIATISELKAQRPVYDLWYDDPRLDTKRWLAERDWNVRDVDLVDKAGAYGRPFQGLPSIFARFMRSKFFTAIRVR